jgi:hypothetical protein
MAKDKPPEPEEGAQDNLDERLQSLQEEVRRLRATVGLSNDRIAELERKLGPTSPAKPVPPPSVAVPVAEPAPKIAAAAIPTKEQIPAVKAAVPIKPPPPIKAPGKPREWEQILGGNWLARVGVVALIIGVAFFLKFAFDNNWLGPISRVILGVVAGLAMVGGGYYWRKKYPTLAQAICGGGIALLYLSIFASFNVFNLIPLYPAVGLLLLVSIGSAALAVRLNSMALAIIGILGAFCAPFILGSAAPEAAQTGQGLQLIVYIIIVDLGVLALSTFRNWRWFNLLALFGSLITYAAWYFQFYDQTGLLAQQLSITFIFIIFFGATSLFHVIWRRSAQAFDYTLMIINAASYFGISYGLMHDEIHAWMGSYTLLFALLYGGLAYLAVQRGPENFRLSLFARGIALVFLTIAIPIQLGDKAWTTIALAAECAVLMWLYLRLRIAHFQGYSYAVFALVIIRLIFFDTSIDMSHFQPVFNERFLAFVVSIAAMYLTGYFLWKRQQESGEKLGYSVFLIAGNIFAIWIIAAEAIGYWDTKVTLQGSLSLIVLLVLAGATILYHAVWRRVPRTFDLVLLVISAAAYFGISLVLWGDLRTWMGSLYLVFAFFYAGLAYISFRRGAEYARLGSFSLGLALVFLTIAIPVERGDTAWTPIGWAAELILLVWLSFRLRLTQLRYYGYALAVILAGRLLIWDTTIDLQNFRPLLNERFLAFLVGIAAIYIASYLLWRARDNLPKWNIPVTTLIVAANFLTLWLLSFEAWDFFGAQLAQAPADSTAVALRNAQNLSLTVLWTLYAVILLVIGIVKRWRLVRLGALALLAIPVIKLFVYDVFALERVYRIVAFVGLGLLLIISAYLYQRYRKSIRGFLVNK